MVKYIIEELLKMKIITQELIENFKAYLIQEEKAQISGYNIDRLTRNENVTVDVLARICIALDCGFDDIVEIVDTDIKDK